MPKYFKAVALLPSATKGRRIRIVDLQTKRITIDPWNYERNTIYDQFREDKFLFDDGNWSYFERGES